MFNQLFDSNARQLKKYNNRISEINSYEQDISKLTDEQLREKTAFWKSELQNIKPDQQDDYLNSILSEAYAVVRESAKRVLNMRHYDVQLLAGIILHEGKVAEQKTGEGKTLTATLPLYLNALTGKGAHLVTPNDYLSRHGAGWMGSIYNFLGLTVSTLVDDRAFKFDPDYDSSEFKDEYSKVLKHVERQEAYQCDITYGTNHQFGFDYLRDNMAYSLRQMVQTNPNGDWGVHNYAIVDEVDSILIDMARTPLIISTTASKPTERYHQATTIIKQLINAQDYELDEKFRTVSLTDLGIRKVEKMLKVGNLYEEDFEMVHLIEQALYANTLYEKDKDYVVKDGKVVIVDQFTGRLLPSNSFGQGLHQAIESKEGVEIQEESRTRAEISYQNYFRMYKKLAGMTGTAITEAEELHKIYGLDVLVLPTNKPVARADHNDVIYKTESAKFKAVADEIEEYHNRGQPVLIGTTSVEKSQLLHQFLNRRKIKHQVLNAKNHEQEALIIAQAGKKNAVTLSTNMAGRGVDILLGGDPIDPDEQNEVLELGGLHVIGTERHESRRIDNQLRGRSGRQGDPGSSRFFVSLQDSLMRVFGGAQVENLMNKFGLEDNVPLEAGLVTKAIQNAQKKVEGFNFDARKRVIEQDDVINIHRDVVYKLRRRILEIASRDFTYKDWLLDKLLQHADENSHIKSLWKKFEEVLTPAEFGDFVMRTCIPVIDMLWEEHLVDMAQLRQGIYLRGYAQKDPIVEYKREGHEKFELLVTQLYSSIVERIEHIHDAQNIIGSSAKTRSQDSQDSDLVYQQGSIETGVAEEASELAQANSGKSSVGQQQVQDKQGRVYKIEKVKSGVKKVGRNDPCPCGSGKKYKKCHGK